MGVYVKGMKMPKDCRECRMQTYSVETGETWCLPADALLADDYRSIQFYVRPEWCPIVEVPKKHGRLIDADELKTAFPTCDNSKPILVASVRATINHMPTVIEAECE